MSNKWFGSDTEYGRGSLDEQDFLARHLVGRKVVAVESYSDEWVNGFVLVLEGGSEVLVSDAQDCCAYYGAILMDRGLVGNIVTAVSCTDRVTDDDGDESFTITLLGVNRTLADIQVSGNPGNGFYVDSIELRARAVNNAGAAV